ncbi:hypothetical protein [Caballeronia cordobensis]|uniref:hypothetical protein n=1 Tax=Caballeronia cordobensis TaxID=1353886 RepID=UPI0006AD6666|nr:hypothetical protein [Caballeronia cordobensis]
MRIQARPGSKAGQAYFRGSGLPGRKDGKEIGDQPIFKAGEEGDLRLVFKEMQSATQTKRMPVEFLCSNAVHGAEGPIDAPTHNYGVNWSEISPCSLDEGDFDSKSFETFFRELEKL